MFFSILKKT